MAWLRHRLRDADVWAKVDATGTLVTDRDGRVEVVYKPDAAAKVYRAGARNLAPVPGERAVEFTPAEPAPSSSPAARASVTGEPIHVWTDGACTGNPGPCGVGVLIVDDKTHTQRELSEYLGMGTNNIAELTAILRGLQEVPDRTRPVIVYSDSMYSIGLLTQNWKAKANQELVAELRALVREFPSIKFVKVAGHAGVELNERVDELARQAVMRNL